MTKDKPDQLITITSETPRILRLKEVMQLTGLSRTGIYERIKNGGFPQQVNLGGRSVGFVESEVNTWILIRINARQSEQGKEAFKARSRDRSRLSHGRM